MQSLSSLSDLRSSASPAPLTIPIAEVAALLGRDVEGVKRRYRQLVATGFPRRLPGSDWCFSRALVRAWVNAQGGTVVSNDNVIPVGSLATSGVLEVLRDANAARAADLVELQREALSRKYGERA